MPTLIDYYMQKTGKQPDEISILERQALIVALEYMKEESLLELEKRKHDTI